MRCNVLVAVPIQRRTSCTGDRVSTQWYGAGFSGLFIEAHPDPDNAKCDGPCALPLHQLENYLEANESN